MITPSLPDYLYVLEYPIKINKFYEVYIKELVEHGEGRKVKHIATTVPRPFRGKTSGPPYIYVWWRDKRDDGRYYYQEDLNLLIESLLRKPL
jgi:hypothetical protein